MNYKIQQIVWGLWRKSTHTTVGISGGLTTGAFAVSTAANAVKHLAFVEAAVIIKEIWHDRRHN
ncbi:MAG: hypothetical protein ACE5J2_00665 [Nitrososphaerales archaeon]